MTTATAEVASTRLVMPAPGWIALAAAFTAAFVAPWRRTPLTAAPAALAWLPWLPLPIPAAGLLWTGYLAWVPLVLAVVAAGVTALTSGAAVGTGPVDRPAGRLPPRDAALAGLLTIAAGGLVLASIGNRLPGGDEPHYLILAESLLEDGDLRIENQHAERQYASWWHGELRPHYIARGEDGRIYSIHAPGVAVLVAPLFALAGVAGAQATMLLFAGAGGALLWTLGWMTTGSRSAAWFAWAAIATSATLLVQSVTIFPDGPGATFTAAAAVIWIGFRQRRMVRRRWLVLAGSLLAALPFLHTRFVVLAVSLGALFIADLAARRGTDRRRAFVAFGVVPTMSAIAWFAYFQLIYGTPDPTAPYGPNPESSVSYVPGGMLGLLVDQQFGLLTVSPVLVLAIVGWWRAARLRTAAAVPSLRLLPVVVLYLAAVATYWMWWAGVPATPARFATAILPLLAVPIASVWRSGSTFVRSLAVTLLVATAAISVLLLGSGGEFTWASRGGRAEWLDVLGTTADLARAWPSFFWRVIGGDVRSEWPFAVHAIVVVAIAVVVALALAMVSRRGRSAGASVVAGVLVLPLVLTAAAPAGWALNDATGLWPAASQVRILGGVAEGGQAFSIAPVSIRRLDLDRLTPAIEVTLPPLGLPTEPRERWGTLTDVPAGRYTLRITSPRPAGGRFAVHLSPLSVGGVPVVDEELVPQSRHLIDLDLPHDAPVLRVDVADSLARPGTQIALIPVRIAGR